MAMVISPRSKIVTLALLIGIIILAALIILGVIGVWHRNEKTSNNNNNNNAGTKVMSSKLQQITGYAAMQHVSKNKKRERETTLPIERTRLRHVKTGDVSPVLDRAISSTGVLQNKPRPNRAIRWAANAPKY